MDSVNPSAIEQWSIHAYHVSARTMVTLCCGRNSGYRVGVLYHGAWRGVP